MGGQGGHQLQDLLKLQGFVKEPVSTRLLAQAAVDFVSVIAVDRDAKALGRLLHGRHNGRRGAVRQMQIQDNQVKQAGSQVAKALADAICGDYGADARDIADPLGQPSTNEFRAVNNQNVHSGSMMGDAGEKKHQTLPVLLSGESCWLSENPYPACSIDRAWLQSQDAVARCRR